MAPADLMRERVIDAKSPEKTFVMDRTNPKEPDRDPTPGQSSEGNARRSPILGLLRDLLTELARVREGSVPSDPVDMPLTLWQDDKNIYINLDITGEIDLDVDITVC